MKIVHICLAGPVTDGWNYQDNMITKYHKRLGHEVTMITSQWVWGTKGKLEKYESTNYLNCDGVKVIRLPLKGRNDFSKKFKRYKGLGINIKNENPDILFIHNVSFLDVQTIIEYLKKNNSVKVYVDNHADFSNSATNWVSKNILHGLIWKFLARSLVPYTEKFYGVLPARVDFLTNLYGVPSEKTELLVMGADDEEVVEARRPNVTNQLRERYKISKNDFLIVSGGKIDEAKTQTLLLMEAVSNLQKDNVKLIVFGSIVDSLKDKMSRLIDNKKIQYIGWIEPKDSYKYFAAAELVVFPGRHSVFWEQVAGQGIPMICKYWRGTTHVDVGGNVKFLKSDSEKEIRTVIEELMSDKQKYEGMKTIAMNEGIKVFSYKEIAIRSISNEHI